MIVSELTLISQSKWNTYQKKTPSCGNGTLEKNDGSFITDFDNQSKGITENGRITIKSPSCGNV